MQREKCCWCMTHLDHFHGSLFVRAADEGLVNIFTRNSVQIDISDDFLIAYGAHPSYNLHSVLA